MKFVDEAKIFLRSGKGGKGCVSFNHEKYREFGGPDGGNGGKGGDILACGSKSIATLYDLKTHPHQSAGAGQGGLGKQKNGRKGNDKMLIFPIGTIIRCAETNRLLAEILDESIKVLVPGGRGGKGNMHFKSPRNKTPRFAQEGESGTEISIHLELQLIADVGLVGFPNAGKSTYISVISAAKPRVADYPFTTLTPNLGVVVDEMQRSFVVADIPGIISGSHSGAGLGTRFLKHIRRTSLLAFLVSCSPEEEQTPIEIYKALRKELELFSPELLDKPKIILLTKMDLISDQAIPAKIIETFDQETQILAISSATGKGITETVKTLATLVEKEREKPTTEKIVQPPEFFNFFEE